VLGGRGLLWLHGLRGRVVRVSHHGARVPGRSRLLLLQLRQLALHLAIGGSVALWATAAHAVPGPDSVAVVANANVPESVALADAYAAARDIPARQVCRLDLPTTVDITLDEYRTRFDAPFEACLTGAGVLSRIEAVVLARGVPLRVLVPTAGGSTETAALAAVLGVWRSDIAGTPFLGQEPGRTSDCGGTPCRAAAWRNAFERQRVFEPGWSRDVAGITWRPMLVTMLHGRTYADAMRLVTSAIDGDRMGGARGQAMFMNGADAARGALDTEYDMVMSSITAAGFTDVVRVPFDSNLEGRMLATFVTGTASLGRTIEGNTFAPGAIVDNLTSFGAVPANFDATGESQVSIARWVSLGVAGAHGTVDEPLNNCFPSRYFVADYLRGSTLGEAYHRRLPYVYWKNLVLGDPITAPYATRPVVTFEGVMGGDTLAGPRSVTVRATDAMGRAVGSIVLFADGVEVARADGDMLETCLDLAPGTDIALLAVAQVAYDAADPNGPTFYQPKGWSAIRVSATAGAGTCMAAGMDAGGGPVDAGTPPGSEPPPRADAGSVPPPPMGDSGGCGCRVATLGPERSLGALFAGLGLAGTWWVAKRRRRRARR